MKQQRRRRLPLTTTTWSPPPCRRVSSTCISEMQVGCRPSPLWWLWWRRASVPRFPRAHTAHVPCVCRAATAESKQQSEWQPRSATEWIKEAIRPTDVRISMGPTADDEVACDTCRGYHCSHPCPLAALVRAQTEDYQLRQAQLFPEEEEEEEEAEKDRHGRGDTSHTVSVAAAALLQLQAPVVCGEPATFIYCAAVPLTAPIRCAPHTASVQADALRPIVAPWVLVALGEIVTLPDAATTRAALLRMRRQLSQLVAPATALFEATRGMRPVNGEGYVVEEEVMQDHLPVPRVGGTLDASSALVEVLDGMALGADCPQLQRPPTAWSAFCQGSAATRRSDNDDNATTLTTGAGGAAKAGAAPASGKHSEDDTTATTPDDVAHTRDDATVEDDDIWTTAEVPDVALHWWDRDAECGWVDDYVYVCRVDTFFETCLAPGTTLPPHERDSTRCCALGPAGGSQSASRYVVADGEVL